MAGEPNTMDFELRKMELDIRMQEIKLPKELASLGLQGTLTGALAGGLLIFALAIISACVEQPQITGNHLCIMFGMLLATIALYGAYVFERSLNISTNMNTGSASVSSDVAKAAAELSRDQTNVQQK
jgi:hypothetical protein